MKYTAFFNIYIQGSKLDLQKENVEAVRVKSGM